MIGRGGRLSVPNTQMSDPVVGWNSVNASSRPSGDHDVAVSAYSRVVSRSATPLRSAGLQKRFGTPAEVDSYVRRVPSGVQMARAFRPSNVSWVNVWRDRSWTQTFRSPCVHTATR